MVLVRVSSKFEMYSHIKNHDHRFSIFLYDSLEELMRKMVSNLKNVYSRKIKNEKTHQIQI